MYTSRPFKEIFNVIVNAYQTPRWGLGYLGSVMGYRSRTVRFEVIRGLPSCAANDEIGILGRLIEKSLSGVIRSATTRGELTVFGHHSSMSRFTLR